MKAQKKWRCYSLCAPKRMSFLISLSRKDSEETTFYKIQYLVAQPLLFGRNNKGLVSFIITGCEESHLLAEEQKVEVVKILTELQANRNVSFYKIKEIDEGAIRVTVVFTIKSQESFALKMIQTSLIILNSFPSPYGNEPVITLEQIDFECVTYLRVDSIWLTELQALYSQLGKYENDRQDQAIDFKANVGDLF